MGVRRIVALISDLQTRQAIKFSYRDEGIQREGFVALFQGQVVCYQNTCRHIPITLDYGDGRFFNREGTHFICQTHGATYEPSTGLCVAGPCPGTSLKKLEVEVIGNEVWFTEPE
jgi:nitrite reductase/ring-hydroxylating ferredoxin subunit